MKALLASILAVAALLSASPARSAKIVTIDFEDQTQEVIVVANLTIRGFRFSPNCHYDLLGPSSGVNHSSQWIGFDGQGCGTPETTNQNYLGTAALGPSLWVDYSETPFSLLGLDPIADRSDWSLISSNGGNFISTFTSNHVDFSGFAWTDISWLLFTDLAQGGFPVGFDNISFRVPDRSLPEPATTLLVALGLASIAIVRRKRRAH